MPAPTLVEIDPVFQVVSPRQLEGDEEFDSPGG